MNSSIIWIDNGPTEQHRNYLIKYVKNKKAHSVYKVLDIGANANSWTKEIADATVDIVVDVDDNSRLVGDVMDIATYSNIGDDWDLIILSHILEDVRDPFFVWNSLKDKSKEFYISSPSKFAEFGNPESLQFKGWHHHRWILTSDQNALYVTTKTSMVNAFGKNRLGLKVSALWIYLKHNILKIGSENFHNFYGYSKMLAGQNNVVKGHDNRSISLITSNKLRFILEDLDPAGKSIFQMYQDLLIRKY
jgi:hypothetical protein